MSDPIDDGFHNDSFIDGGFHNDSFVVHSGLDKEYPSA